MMLGWIKYTDGTIYLVGTQGIETWAILEFSQSQYEEFQQATKDFTDKLIAVPSPFLKAFEKDELTT